MIHLVVSTMILHSSWFLVEGVNPEPWEASQSSTGRKNGKVYTHFHKPDQLRSYQEALAEELKAQNPHYQMFEGELSVFFYFWRQLDVSEIDDRKRRAHTADATNLLKAAEDALQDVLYVNDQSNRQVQGVIVAQGHEVNPFVLICVQQYDKTLTVLATEIRNSLIKSDPQGPSNIRKLDVDAVF